MLQEESTELALAARKYIRVQNDENFDALTEEIADVEILIEQIKTAMLPEASYEVLKWKVYKLHRLNQRINEQKFES